MIDTGVWNNAADQISQLQGIAQSNSAASAQQAALQRDWTQQMSAQATATNISEAAKNRNWQEFMSNTAHQREVADLRAAGLNPVLSAMNGNGAAVTSGATAQAVSGTGTKGDVDTSASGAVANLLGSILTADKAIEAANINARTQEAVADKYTAMEKIVADISADTSRYSADSARVASMYGSDRAANATTAAAAIHGDATKTAAAYGAMASMFGSTKSSAATKYAANKSSGAVKYSADVGSQTADKNRAADMATNAQYGKGWISNLSGSLANALTLGNAYRSKYKNYVSGKW